MISANFSNFDPAGNLPKENSDGKISGKDFAAVFDQKCTDPANASVTFQNAVQQSPKDAVNAKLKTSAEDSAGTAPNGVPPYLHVRQTGQSPVKTPPVIIMPEVPTAPVETPPIFASNDQSKETKITVNTPPIIAAPDKVKDSEIVTETPPIIVAPPVVTTTPPIIADSQKIKHLIIKADTPHQTPPILVLPDSENLPTRLPPLEVNPVKTPTTGETPPIIVQPENPNLPPPRMPPQEAPQPNVDMNEQRFAVAKQNGLHVRKETDAAENPVNPTILTPVDMSEQQLNLGKITGRVIRREFSQSINETNPAASDTDSVQISIPNEAGSISFTKVSANVRKFSENIGLVTENSGVKTENTGNPTESAFKFQNVISVIKNSESTETAEKKTGNSEISAEINAGPLAKADLPKKKSISSTFESADFIHSEGNLNKNIEITEISATNSLEKAGNVAEQIEPRITELAAKVEQSKETQIMKMRLHPADLGMVEIHLEKNVNGHLEAHFKTENEGARSALHENIEQLRNTLEKAGWQIASMDVSASAASTSSFGNTQQNGENPANNYYQSFSAAENAAKIPQTESNEKDELQHIVSLRA